MTDFQSIEWYTEQLEENKRTKEIFLHALENVARRDFPNYELIDDIANRIANLNGSIQFWENEIKIKVGEVNAN